LKKNAFAPPSFKLRQSIECLLEKAIENPADIPLQANLRRLIEKRNGKIIRVKYDTEAISPVCPTISLCMIVKNEEKTLADCLQSVYQLADQIIVVDTGSNDKTIEIARSYGAQVEHFPWIDDFSAARNESLKYATGDWVLILDADERLLKEDCLNIRKAVSSGHGDIYLCLQKHIDSEEKNVVDVNLIDRLFQNHLGIRFQNAIHETVIPYAVEKELVIAETEISIQHVGRLPGADQVLKKGKRNLEIVEKVLQKDPQNQFARLLTALLHYGQGHIDQSIALLEETLKAIPDFPPPSIYLGQGYLLLINHLIEQRQTEKIKEIIGQVLIDFPETHSLWVFVGSIYLNILGNYEKAEKVLERAGSL
jgi:tetratricopeptide (TPR) repeat protein